MASLNDKNFSFDEMMVHVPMCTHKEPEKILIIGDVSEVLKQEVAKHPVDAQFGDLSLLTSKNEQEFDIIILTQDKIDATLMANINRILNKNGIMVIATANYEQDATQVKNDLTLLGESFWIAMPFYFNGQTAILASKKFHPTADIILQRSDLIEDVSYYSTEIQHAAFTFPAYIHKELTGIAKR